MFLENVTKSPEIYDVVAGAEGTHEAGPLQ
jgi:hypothetical protein